MSANIFVAGLHGSGTTLLHFLVGMHPQTIPLGEIWSYITIDRRAFCSCGQWEEDCPFWGGVKERTYAAVAQRASECYGPERIIVDSSKSPQALQELRKLGEAKALFAIRDVRGWAIKQEAESIRVYLRWFRANRKQMQAVGDHLVVSYDELALRLEPSRRRIMAYLELDYVDGTDFTQIEHHAIHANPMRNQKAKLSQVAYDHRWLAKNNPWPAVLLPSVMRFNQKHVYNLVTNLYTLKHDDERLHNPAAISEEAGQFGPKATPKKVL